MFNRKLADQLLKGLVGWVDKNNSGQQNERASPDIGFDFGDEIVERATLVRGCPRRRNHEVPSIGEIFPEISDSSFANSSGSSRSFIVRTSIHLRARQILAFSATSTAYPLTNAAPSYRSPRNRAFPSSNRALAIRSSPATGHCTHSIPQPAATR